jgi:hypothetical protein
MSEAPSVEWLKQPESHDFDAATTYLSLLIHPQEAQRVVAGMKSLSIIHQAAKDILRASRLPLLRQDNVHVAKDMTKMRHNTKLSPVLLIRGDVGKQIPVTIADGYHRVCACEHWDENTSIPCLIGSWY